VAYLLDELSVEQLSSLRKSVGVRQGSPLPSVVVQPRVTPRWSPPDHP
jgi:hypothetical protein